MNLWLAVIIGAALVAGAYVISHRYTAYALNGADDYSVVWRIDQWTGKMLICDYGKGFTEPACTKPSSK
jgi:hypothetical protein